MTYLHLGHVNETRIFSPSGAILRTSKNLRGMRDYARVSPVFIVETKRDPANPVRGILRVTYADTCYSIASFADYHIMLDFVRNRRTWRSARHLMQNEDMGYLTKPGIIAGPRIADSEICTDYHCPGDCGKNGQGYQHK